MRDFFEDSEKVEPKDDNPAESEKVINSDEIRKAVGIEVKKAMDLFKSEWEESHKQTDEPKDETKDDPQDEQKE